MTDKEILKSAMLSIEEIIKLVILETRNDEIDKNIKELREIMYEN